MPLIEWNAEMSVGVEEFDSHHQKLFSLANRLYDAVAENRDKEVIAEVVCEVSNYTIYHFFAEEELMEEYGYPGYSDHRNEHIELTRQTLELMEDLKNNKPGIGTEVLEFLREWTNHHIFGTDQKYKEFFISKGVK
jgi:hemerythrin-like metal-binding protein